MISVKKLLFPILSIFLLTSCSSENLKKQNIELVDFKEQENVSGETGTYFNYSSYLYVYDKQDRTYIGEIDKIISPSNNNVAPYDYQFRLTEIGLYRVYFNYEISTSDIRAKTLYVNSKDQTGPEVFFNSASKGYLGIEYTFPNPISNDNSGLPVSFKYNLYLLKEEGEGREQIDFSGKSFIPKKTGIYRYEAIASDCNSNTSSAYVDFEVIKDTPLIHEKLDESNYTTIVKANHSGGSSISGVHYDTDKQCYAFNCKSQDNLYINADKNIKLAEYDLIRVKTKCSSDVTNAFIQAELDGPGTGNKWAYYTRRNENGFAYFEMSVEKFLPYWDHISFNLAFLILLTKNDMTTSFEFYDVQLVKNAEIVFNSPSTINVKTPYKIDVSCEGAIEATFTHIVTDPLGQIVDVENDSFTPTMIGQYKIVTKINHFFYEGEITNKVESISSKKIVVSSFISPSLDDIFTLPTASLDGNSTGFNISVSRDGEAVAISNNKISVDKNARYTISYSKTLDGVIYSKKVHFDVGVTHLETFSSIESLSKAYGSPVDRVSLSYLEEYSGEDGVVSFDYTSRYPNMFFSCPNLSNYDFSKYSTLSFDMFMPDTILNLNGRYGNNNESQDLTYYSNNKGVKHNQWSTYSYPVSEMFDDARFEQMLPFMLIGVETEKENYNGRIYVSDIYLTEKTPKPLKYGIDFDDSIIPNELTISGASETKIVKGDTGSKVLAVTCKDSSTKISLPNTLINDMFTVDNADGIFFDIKISENPSTTNCFYFESTTASNNVVNYNSNTGGINTSWQTYYFPKTALAEIKDGVIIRVDNQIGKTIYIDNIRPGIATLPNSGIDFNKAFIVGKNVFNSVYNPATHMWENVKVFSVDSETGMNVSLSLSSVPNRVYEGTQALRVTTDCDGRFMCYISQEFYNALPTEGLSFDIYSEPGSMIFNMLEDYQVSHAWKVFTYTRSGKWTNVIIPKASIRSDRLMMFRTQDPGDYIDFFIDNIRLAK